MLFLKDNGLMIYSTGLEKKFGKINLNMRDNIFKGKNKEQVQKYYIGKYTWNNGTYYEGEWMNSKMNGIGA